MVGTVAYMAPEQALGKDPDARSDLYSFGVMLYEMLCGRPPFLGPDPVGVLSQHINTPPVAPSWHNPEIQPALEKLIMDLLEKEPDHRPGSATEVRERLARASILSVPREEPDPVEPSPADGEIHKDVFVDRHSEMAQLKTALSQAFSGQGRVVLIEGEPGIGKTRLAEELVKHARAQGVQVLASRCHQEEGVPAYWPWIKIIRV